MSGTNKTAMDSTITMGKKGIFLAIPLYFPMSPKATLYSSPASTNRLGTINVEKVESMEDIKFVVKRGKEMDKVSNKS